jgi:hypothetical protein
MTTRVHEIGASGAASGGPASLCSDELDDALDTELDDALDTELDDALDTGPDEELDTGPDDELDTGPDDELDTGPDEELVTRLDEKLDRGPDDELDGVLDDDTVLELDEATSFLPPSVVVPTLLLLLQPTAPARSSEATETPSARQPSTTRNDAFMGYVLPPKPACAPIGLKAGRAAGGVIPDTVAPPASRHAASGRPGERYHAVSALRLTARSLRRGTR